MPKVPIYKTIDGQLWLGCKSFQKEPVDHVEIVEILDVRAIERPNDAWVYCDITVIVTHPDETRHFRAKMSSTTFYDIAWSGFVASEGQIDFVVPLEMICSNPEWEIAIEGARE